MCIVKQTLKNKKESKKIQETFEIICGSFIFFSNIFV
jgi:hypothetical protein